MTPFFLDWATRNTVRNVHRSLGTMTQRISLSDASSNHNSIRNNLRKAKYKPRIIPKVRYHALEHDAAAYACNFGQTVTPKA